MKMNKNLNIKTKLLIKR